MTDDPEATGNQSPIAIIREVLNRELDKLSERMDTGERHQRDTDASTLKHDSDFESKLADIVRRVENLERVAWTT